MAQNQEGRPSPPAQPESALTNDDVVKLSTTGVGEALIIAKIKEARRVAFRLDAESLVQLVKEKVAEAVILAMLGRDRGRLQADRPLCEGVWGDEPQAEVVTLTYFHSLLKPSEGASASATPEDPGRLAGLPDLATALNRMFAEPKAKAVSTPAKTSEAKDGKSTNKKGQGGSAATKPKAHAKADGSAQTTGRHRPSGKKAGGQQTDGQKNTAQRSPDKSGTQPPDHPGAETPAAGGIDQNPESTQEETKGKTVVEDLGFGRLLLHGTRCQNLQIKRALLRIDLPWPQVQLNIWAVQVSGTDEKKVSKQIHTLGERISVTHDTIVRVQEELKSLAARDPHQFATWPQFFNERFAAFGKGPLSLNEALILLALAKDRNQRIEELRNVARGECRKFSAALCKSASCVRQEPREADSAELDPCRQPFVRLGEVVGRLPLDLSSTFGQLFESYDSAQELRYEPVTAEPDAEKEQERKLNDIEFKRDLVDRVLRSLMDAYAADMEDLFFRPLLESVRTEPGSRGSSGTALVGRARIVVNSGMEADLSPETASYAETTRPQPFGKDLLDLAFPAKKSDGTAVGTDRILSGLPQLQATLLASALLSEPEPRYVKVAPGIAISVRPVVLPDESAARLTIDARFGVKTEDLDPKARKDLWAQPPPASITSHHVTTDATVNVFDLFDISSFSIDVTTPRPPLFVPILGRLPILGPAFQWPRSNKTVRHESIILVNTIVLPRTTMLIGRF